MRTFLTDLRRSPQKTIESLEQISVAYFFKQRKIKFQKFFRFSIFRIYLKKCVLKFTEFFHEHSMLSIKQPFLCLIWRRGAFAQKSIFLKHRATNTQKVSER